MEEGGVELIYCIPPDVIRTCVLKYLHPLVHRALRLVSRRFANVIIPKARLEPVVLTAESLEAIVEENNGHLLQYLRRMQVNLDCTVMYFDDLIIRHDDAVTFEWFYFHVRFNSNSYRPNTTLIIQYDARYIAEFYKTIWIDQRSQIFWMIMHSPYSCDRLMPIITDWPLALRLSWIDVPHDVPISMLPEALFKSRFTLLFDTYRCKADGSQRRHCLCSTMIFFTQLILFYLGSDLDHPCFEYQHARYLIDCIGCIPDGVCTSISEGRGSMRNRKARSQLHYDLRHMCGCKVYPPKDTKKSAKPKKKKMRTDSNDE